MLGCVAGTLTLPASQTEHRPSRKGARSPGPELRRRRQSRGLEWGALGLHPQSLDSLHGSPVLSREAQQCVPGRSRGPTYQPSAAWLRVV